MLLSSDLIRFAHPTLNVRIEVSFGVYAERVADKVGRILFYLEESGVVIDPGQREAAD